MKDRILFLGTGTSTGVPVLTCECEVCCSASPFDSRLRTSAFIEYKGLKLIIDCGPDFRQQLLREKISDFDALLLTHGHRDHIAGLDDLRAFNYIRGKTIDVYADTTTQQQISVEFPYIFNPGDYGGPPKLNLSDVGNDAFYINEIPIIPLPVLHGNAQIIGFRFGAMAYITDASQIPPATMALLEGVDTLVLNALRKRPHATHFSLEEAMEMARIIGAQHTYFTHISHFIGLHETVQSELPESMMLAYDGLSVSF